MNTPIQGTAADIIKIAMVRVRDRLLREGLESRLILQVHDELILEAPKTEQETAMRLLKEEMEAAFAMDAPLVAEGAPRAARAVLTGGIPKWTTSFSSARATPAVRRWPRGCSARAAGRRRPV